jgi:hypothetical protein
MRFSWFTALRTLSFTFLILFVTPIFAWNENGHMLVAKIDYEKLKPEAREKIDRLVGYLHQEYADINTFPQAAVWADKLRGQQLDVYTHWHYIDQPLVKDGGNPDAHTIDSDNAMWAIDKIRSFVSNDKANPYERARFLAFLVHIVGDIHQPLHTVSLVTPKFPNGDRGGNDYFVSYRGKRTNVHKIWDDGVGAFEHSYSADEEVGGVELKSRAAAIADRYPRAYFTERLAQSNVQDWLKEGMTIASDSVYSAPENQPVSVDYTLKGSAIAEQQVAIAGYRLAEMLNQLFA